MGRISNALVEARLTEARALMSQGVTVRFLADRWGIERDAAKQFLRRHRLGRKYGMKVVPRKAAAEYRRAKIVGNEPKWQNADPSGLTPDQLDQAMRLGIKPSRYAWLLLCPRGGNAVGWRGGNTIG